MKLQQAPTGLIGLFNLKATGQNPDEFRGEVIPVVDVTLFYGQRVRSIYRDELISDGPGPSFAELGPPQGEAWLVNLVSITVLRDVADISLRLRAALRLQRSNSVSVATVFSVISEPVVGAADLSEFFGYWLPRPLLLSDGDTIRLSCQDTSSQLTTYSMHLDVAVLPG